MLELHKENKDTLFEGIHRISFLSYYGSDKVINYNIRRSGKTYGWR